MSKKRKPTPEIKLDGYENIFTGLGTNRDPHKHTVFKKGRIIPDDTLEDIYEQDGLGRRIVDLPAEEMFREGFVIETKKEHTEVLDLMETLHTAQICTEAVVWARLFGGSMVIAVFDDTDDFGTPLPAEGPLPPLVGFHVVDRRRVSSGPDPLRLSQNPIKRLQGHPEFYEVSTGLIERPTLFVHESRLHRVQGRRTTEARRRALSGWDSSVLYGVIDQLTAYNTSQGYALTILRDFVQAVLSVKDLANLFMAGREEVVKKRLQTLDLSRSLLNAMVIDADGEQYTKSSSSVAGIPDIIDRFSEALSAACGIPVTKLFGRSPAGMSSTGESDMRNYYDTLAVERERVAGPLVEWMIPLLFRSTIGEPDAWSVRWNSFQQPSELDIATLRKTVADSDKIYVDSGILSPQEVADSRWRDGEWSMETTIDTTTKREKEAKNNKPEPGLGQPPKKPTDK